MLQRIVLNNMYEIIFETIEVIGVLMVAFTAIRVHHRVLQEHEIDEKVYAEMKREQVVGVLGMGLIAIGFVMKVIMWVYLV